LNPNELVIGDGTYADETCLYSDDDNEELTKLIRARQETVFRRFKSFNVLQHRYRHNLTKHSSIFFAIANLIQSSIIHGEELFEIDELV